MNHYNGGGCDSEISNISLAKKSSSVWLTLRRNYFWSEATFPDFFENLGIWLAKVEMGGVNKRKFESSLETTINNLLSF